MKFCQNCGRPTSPSAAGPGSPDSLGVGPTPLSAQPPPPQAPPPRPNPVTPPPRGPAATPLPMSSPASLVPGAMRAGGESTCPSCGGSTPSGLRFCQRCGANTGAAPSDGVPATVPGPSPRVRNPGPSLSHGPTAPPSDSGAAVRSQRWGTLVCLNRDGSQGAEYPLAGEFVDVGKDGQVRFDDPFLAPRHLRLSRESGALFAVPLDQINGSFLRVVEQTPLEPSCILLLGRELLRFEQLAADEREVSPAVQHGVYLFGSPIRDAWGRLHQLLPNGCVRDVRHLIGAEVIIGREEGDVVFSDDEFLSRRHASLHWRDNRCYLQDLGSSNGSFLRIRQRVQLKSGAQLRFGDQMVRIDITA